jgi:hypothetical protein
MSGRNTEKSTSRKVENPQSKSIQLVGAVINPGAGEKVRWGWDQAISLLRDKQSQL